jgi:hypothetical protein
MVIILGHTEEIVLNKLLVAIVVEYSELGGDPIVLLGDLGEVVLLVEAQEVPKMAKVAKIVLVHPPFKSQHKHRRVF